MNQARILRIVVASPGDVIGERNAVAAVTDYLNKGIANDRGLKLEVSRWETDAYPRFHAEGPQGGIDEALRIEDCDVLIGIFWKRFGTPVKNAKSGTEHELFLAYNNWKNKGRPQIMCYFKKQPSFPDSKKEAEQWGRVIEFQQNFPKEGLWWEYRSKSHFEKLLREHLTHFILDNFPKTSEASSTPITSLSIRAAGLHGDTKPAKGAAITTPFRPPPSARDFARTVCLIFFLIVFIFQSSSHRKAKPLGVNTPESILKYDVPEPTVLIAVLEPYSVLRDRDYTASKPKVFDISTVNIQFKLKLPKGEDEDTYDVTLIDAHDKVLLTAQQIKCVDGESISITISSQFITTGKYRLAVSHDNEAPIYYLFDVVKE
jgi:hypothetical protein